MFVTCSKSTLANVSNVLRYIKAQLKKKSTGIKVLVCFM